MKHLLTMLLVLAASFMAKAELLYWMIDQSSAEDPIDFALAKIVAVPSSGGGNIYLTIGEEGDDFVWAQEPYDANGLGQSTGVVFTDISSLSGTDYSFFIELYSDVTGQDVLVGVSEAAMYSQLSESIYQNGMDYIPTISKAWAPAINVPEPTSGVLMLFGLAALGLRRRRALGC